ncbi:helix-turn-helix domain-containing protein [Paenibacillus yanchengensis]|uniref:Helix-turn-helix domain-containing protein n=1 Tax=Paenibacillus yanchengensis TaxID=2035833 RepID=A0ABW4YF59_9BACL
MMNVFGADDHLLVISNTIDAEEHQHSFLQLTIALEKECVMDVAGQRFGCTGIIINSNVVHRLSGSGYPLLLLLIDSTSSLAVSFKRHINDQKYALLSPTTIMKVREHVQKEYVHVTDSASYSTFLMQMLAILGVEFIDTTIVDDRIKAFITLLKDCSDADHSVSLYAQKIGLSNSRLSHLFKENTGISLSGYIVLHKLQKAVYYIFQGLSITEAAMSAGFDSPSHLATTSKKLLGMTARDIRKDSVFLQVSCFR